MSYSNRTFGFSNNYQSAEWNNQTSNQTQSSAIEVDDREVANQLFLSAVTGMEDVAQVYERFDIFENIAEYWIILEEENRDVRREIYHTEYDFLDHFGGMELLTHVVARNTTGDINLSNGAKEVYNSSEHNALSE